MKVSTDKLLVARVFVFLIGFFLDGSLLASEVKQEKSTLEQAPKAIDRYFRFEDRLGERCGNQYLDFKGWTEPERQKLKSHLSLLLLRAPNFFSKAAGSCRVILLRKTSTHEVSIDPSLPGSTDTLASTDCNEIVFSDRFFALKTSDQLRIILHELTHVADVGDLHSYSQDWLREMYGSRKSKATENERLHKPDAAEALAESVASYVLDSGLLRHQEMERIMFSRLCHPTQDEVSFCKSFQEGMLALRQHKYEIAIARFRSCSKLLPDTPMPHAFLAYTFLKIGNLAAAFDSSVRAEQCVESLSIPLRDNQIIWFYRNHAQLLAHYKNDYAGAEKVLGLVLQVHPDDIGALELRAICSEQLGRNELAEQDRKRVAHIRSSKQVDGNIGSDANFHFRALDNKVRQFIRGSGSNIHGVDVVPLGPIN